VFLINHAIQLRSFDTMILRAQPFRASDYTPVTFGSSIVWSFYQSTVNLNFHMSYFT